MPRNPRGNSIAPLSSTPISGRSQEDRMAALLSDIAAPRIASAVFVRTKLMQRSSSVCCLWIALLLCTASLLGLPQKAPQPAPPPHSQGYHSTPPHLSPARNFSQQGNTDEATAELHA